MLRQLSSTHQSAAPCHADLPWYWLLEALPPGLGTSSALTLEILPCKMLTTPLPTMLSPRLADGDSGTQVLYPTLICVCVFYLS